MIIDALREGQEDGEDVFNPLAHKILDAIGTVIPIAPIKDGRRPWCETCVYHSCCWRRAALPSCPHYIERTE